MGGWVSGVCVSETPTSCSPWPTTQANAYAGGQCHKPSFERWYSTSTVLSYQS